MGGPAGPRGLDPVLVGESSLGSAILAEISLPRWDAKLHCDFFLHMYCPCRQDEENSHLMLFRFRLTVDSEKMIPVPHFFFFEGLCVTGNPKKRYVCRGGVWVSNIVAESVISGSLFVFSGAKLIRRVLLRLGSEMLDSARLGSETIFSLSEVASPRRKLRGRRFSFRACGEFRDNSLSVIILFP